MRCIKIKLKYLLKNINVLLFRYWGESPKPSVEQQGIGGGAVEKGAGWGNCSKVPVPDL